MQGKIGCGVKNMGFCHRFAATRSSINESIFSMQYGHELRLGMTLFGGGRQDQTVPVHGPRTIKPGRTIRVMQCYSPVWRQATNFALTIYNTISIGNILLCLFSQLLDPRRVGRWAKV